MSNPMWSVSLHLVATFSYLHEGNKDTKIQVTFSKRLFHERNYFIYIFNTEMECVFVSNEATAELDSISACLART